jgi:hypothetical protein
VGLRSRLRHRLRCKLRCRRRRRLVRGLRSGPGRSAPLVVVLAPRRRLRGGTRRARAERAYLTRLRAPLRVVARGGMAIGRMGRQYHGVALGSAARSARRAQVWARSHGWSRRRALRRVRCRWCRQPRAHLIALGAPALELSAAALALWHSLSLSLRLSLSREALPPLVLRLSARRIVQLVLVGRALRRRLPRLRCQPVHLMVVAGGVPTLGMPRAARAPPPPLQLDGCQDLLPGADDAAEVLHLRCRPPPAS